jgi:hypothetical protein
VTAAHGAAREAVIDGLEALAAWLRANEDVPVWPHGTDVVFCPRGEDALAEVDRIAAVAGEQPEQRPGMYKVTRKFGPVSYVALVQDETARSAA